MRRITLSALVLAALLPAAAVAQEAELPRALFVSQWQCPQELVAKIGQNYDSLIVPIEQELVNEGKLVGSGMFFHNWGDQWNVNWYRLGQNNAAVFAALEEMGSRMESRHPDAPNLLQSCTAHKDNIYWWGPRTTPPGQ